MSLRSHYQNELAAGRDVSGHDGRYDGDNHRDLTSGEAGFTMPDANRSATPAQPERLEAEPVKTHAVLPPRVHELNYTEAFSWPPIPLHPVLATPDRTFVFSHAHVCAGGCGRALVCNGPAVRASAAIEGGSYYHCPISRDWMCEACELEARDAQIERARASDVRMAEKQAIDVAERQKTPGPYAVICPKHGKVYLTVAEYDHQLMLADSLWECPIAGCAATSEWDDANYEAHRGE